MHAKELPAVSDAAVTCARKFAAQRNLSCRWLLADRNHADIKSDWQAIGFAKQPHLFQFWPVMSSASCSLEKPELNQIFPVKLDQSNKRKRRRGVLQHNSIGVADD